MSRADDPHWDAQHNKQTKAPKPKGRKRGPSALQSLIETVARLEARVLQLETDADLQNHNPIALEENAE